MFRGISRVLIWGTGHWSNVLRKKLPTDCQILAYVESEPREDFFEGVKVISPEYLEEYFDNADFMIVAAANNLAIKKIIFERLKSMDRIYFMMLDDPIQFMSYEKRSLGIELLFQNEYSTDDTTEQKASMGDLGQYVVCDVRGVLFLVNRKSEIMVHALSHGSNYQEKDIELFFSLSRKYYRSIGGGQQYFLDIGANIGTTSIWVKKRLEPRLNIIAFEPVKENCRMFRCSCILNKLEDDEVRLIPMALSNKNSKAQIMVMSENNIGDNRVVVDGNQEDGIIRESIETVRLDDWIQEHHIVPNEIKYIWMDVQAHEGYVLDGGIELLQNARIPLFTEVWPSEMKKTASFELMMSCLKKCYTSFICLYEHGSYRPRPIDELQEVCDVLENECFDIFLIK